MVRINPLVTFANSKFAKKYIEWALTEKPVKGKNLKQTVTNYSKLQKVFPKFFMCFLTGIQCYFLAKSKEMPKERKIPLFITNLYSCAIALAIGAATGKHVNKFTDVLVKKAKNIYKDNPNKTKLINGITTSIPVLNEAILFQYLGFVAAVPLGTKTAEYLFKKGIVKVESSPNRSKPIDNSKKA